MSIFEKCGKPLGVLYCVSVLSAFAYYKYENEEIAFQVVEKLPNKEYIALCEFDDALCENVCVRAIRLGDNDIDELKVGNVYIGVVDRSDFAQKPQEILEIQGVRPTNNIKPYPLEFDLNDTAYDQDEEMSVIRQRRLKNVKDNLTFDYQLDCHKKTREGIYADIENMATMISTNTFFMSDPETMAKLSENSQYCITLKLQNDKGLYLASLKPIEEQYPYRQLRKGSLRPVEFKVMDKNKETKMIRALVYDRDLGYFISDLNANTLFQFLDKGSVYQGKLDGDFIFSAHEKGQTKQNRKVSLLETQQNSFGFGKINQDFEMRFITQNDDNVSLTFNQTNIRQLPVSNQQANVNQVIYERGLSRA